MIIVISSVPVEHEALNSSAMEEFSNLAQVRTVQDALRLVSSNPLDRPWLITFVPNPDALSTLLAASDNYANANLVILCDVVDDDVAVLTRYLGAA